MYIANAYYKAIPVTGATFPLAAGTIVTANGTTPASAEQYFGIVPEKVDKMPTTGYIFVAVSGTIDLDTCGVTFTDAQIKALGADFNFVRAKEEHEPPAPELPTVSAVDNGKVLTVVNGAWAAASGGGGGGGAFIVHAQLALVDDALSITITESLDDIFDALQNEQFVYMICLNTYGYPAYLYLTSSAPPEEGYGGALEFSNVLMQMNGSVVSLDSTRVMMDDGVWEYKTAMGSFTSGQ